MDLAPESIRDTSGDLIVATDHSRADPFSPLHHQWTAWMLSE